MLLGRLQHYKPVTNKKIKGIGSGKATKGNRATHGDIVEQTLTEPNMSVSCTLCSFEITCWTMELARKVVRNHQRRRNPMHPDKDMEQGTYKRMRRHWPKRSPLMMMNKKVSRKLTAMEKT